MKKLTLLIALLVVAAVGSAQAADPALVNPKLNTMKQKLRPAAVKKIKPGMRIVQPGEPEEETPEEPETTEPEGSAALELGELTLTTNNNTCVTQWTSTLSNTGTAASGDLMMDQIIYYRPRENVDMQQNVQADTALDALEAGAQSPLTGYVNGYLGGLDRVVVNIKDGGEVVATSEAALPGEGDYTITLGDFQVANGQFSAPFTVNGSVPLGAMMVIVQAITSADPLSTSPISQNTINCVPVNEPQTVTAAVPAEDHVGYRVMLYRVGHNAADAMRDYYN